MTSWALRSLVPPRGPAPPGLPFLRQALVGVLSAVCLLPAAGPAAAGPDDPTGYHQRLLTPRERELWVEHGLGRGATHLLSQAAEREVGSTTVLNVVVILVDFEDLPADRAAHPPEYYEELLFSRNTHPTGSVADFFATSSRGRFELRGEVRGWYRVSQEKSAYTGFLGGVGFYPRNSQRLAEEAILLANPAVNYARFDNEGADGVPDSGDDDEIVDGIVVVHAGNGREGGSIGPDEFTSIQWRTYSEIPVDGVFGREFTLNPELGNIGIFIHELGHLLGLPDLYPTRASIEGSSFGLGAWSMMAGGLLLGNGVHPGDFDAWSKVRLGFVDAERVFFNGDNVAIPPVHESGKVFRLWANGLGNKEYFLLENRQAVGLDANLPGGGLLIYHVDERVPSNNNPDRYRVALEQADGLYQLENRFGSASAGDPGDPFLEGAAFGRDTRPNSLAYDGSESHVAVFNIAGPDEAGIMRASLRVEPSAFVELLDVNLVELEGNGDGLPAAGELAGIVPRLSVSRLPAYDLQLRIESLDPLGEVLDPLVDFGVVPLNAEVAPESPLRVLLSPEIPGDPYGLKLRMSVDWRADIGRVIDINLGVGTVTGRSDAFEDPDHGWVHDRIRPTAKDQWLYGPSFGVDGSAGFKCGYSGRGYLEGNDAVLVSPPVLLPPEAELVFDQLVDIHQPDPEVVDAGGVVEISVNGGDWRSVVPDGGYTQKYFGDLPDWSGREVYTGLLEEGRFHPVRVDLGDFTGSVQVRFRFFSATTTPRGEGWHIDNVRIRSTVTPVRVLRHEAEVAGGDVLLAWELADPLPLKVRWSRRDGEGPPRALGPWQDPLPSDRFRHQGGAAGLPADYWLAGLERDGTVSRWGPLRVAGPVAPFSLVAVRNPAREVSVLRWSGRPPENAALQIFDARGRLLVEKPLAGDGGEVNWDGRMDDGGRASPGIYFARVRGAGVPPLRIVRLP